MRMPGRLISLLVLTAIAAGQQVVTAHKATLYYQSTACTASTPCNLTVYRAPCPTASTCPPYGNGHGWARISPGITASFIASGGTAWVVTDTDVALKDNTTYVYAAVNTWNSGGSNSGPSPLWSGTTGGANANVPAVPTVGTGNSVH